MSILDLIPDEEPTREDNLNRVAERIKFLTADSYIRLLNIQRSGIETLWNDSEFTPQEIIDSIGPDIVKIFNYHGGLTDFIIETCNAEGITPDILLPTKAFSVSGNTITVLETPYISIL